MDGIVVRRWLIRQGETCGLMDLRVGEEEARTAARGQLSLLFVLLFVSLPLSLSLSRNKSKQNSGNSKLPKVRSTLFRTREIDRFIVRRLLLPLQQRVHPPTSCIHYVHGETTVHS